mmetsp:Transcript_7917/g.18214  ORF Transcript_7917/g.18214 Transcript_7917/m.18214 type:complete len:207 (+) Transcript_7917:150-770(+)
MRRRQARTVRHHRCRSPRVPPICRQDSWYSANLSRRRCSAWGRRRTRTIPTRVAAIPLGNGPAWTTVSLVVPAVPWCSPGPTAADATATVPASGTSASPQQKSVPRVVMSKVSMPATSRSRAPPTCSALAGCRTRLARVLAWPPHRPPSPSSLLLPRRPSQPAAPPSASGRAWTETSLVATAGPWCSLPPTVAAVTTTARASATCA